MSLLQNEDFTIWHLRSSYLSTIKDGVGDRLITVNPSILNTPGFRAAGWSSASSAAGVASAAHIKRTYSPPIPTATAVSSEYFNFAARNNANGNGLGFGFGNDDGEDEERGMVTGGGDSTDTFGRRPHGRGGKRRRKEKQMQQGEVHAESMRGHRAGVVEDDDSSDLSDESDEDERNQSAAQQIKFSKMPVRIRSGSSPIRNRVGGPEVLVTSPSRRSIDSRLRRGSVGAVEAIKARARRDTATSSDLSSENEPDPTIFRRRQIHFSGQDQIIEAGTSPVDEKLEEEDAEIDDLNLGEINEEDEGSGAESVGSALSSEFGATAGSASLLDRVGMVSDLDSSASPILMHKLPTGIDGQGSSPKKTKNSGSVLQDLPPPRPISTLQPVSLLSSALKAKNKVPENPVDRFAALSGKGSTGALAIKIYVPFSEDPEEPFDMPLERTSKDNGAPVTVVEAIGLSLWRYTEEGLKPPIEGEKLNVNRWTLRMVEDGEVEYDFPPLGRARPMVDFTSNNNRAAGARGRSRSKPYDEFALVEATAEEFKENERLFPNFSRVATVDDTSDMPTPVLAQTSQLPPPAKVTGGRSNPILGQPFSSALDDNTLTPADRPAVPTSHATPRMGVQKTLKIRFIDLESSTQTTTVNTSTDSYIAEILDSVCKRWALDKGNYILKVVASNTFVPLDRTVEALGTISELDLVRRRFGGGPLSLTGSPGSSSPNAPLLVENNAAAKKGKRGVPQPRMLHPLAQQQDLLGGYYRRYNVIRKQSMSFTSSNQRILTFDNDYMHIMPGETGKTLFDTHSKTTSISFNDVIGCKVSRRHPKSFRVMVLRGSDASEQKRYDFEAKNAYEATEIVDEIKKNMAHYKM